MIQYFYSLWSNEYSPIPQLLRIAPTRIVQLGLCKLFGRIAQLGLRYLACANTQDCRNFQDCATLLAQLVALRNSACATAFDRLRNSQDCATLLVQLRWPDWATLQLHFLQNNSSPHRAWKWHVPSTRARRYPNSHPPWNLKLTWGVHKVKTISKLPPSWNLKTDLGCPQG